MARTETNFWIFNAEGDLHGKMVYAEDAAAAVGFLGEGASVRFAGSLKSSTLWTEGADGLAYESYDAAAAFMHGRIQAVQRASYEKNMKKCGIDPQRDFHS